MNGWRDEWINKYIDWMYVCDEWMDEWSHSERDGQIKRKGRDSSNKEEEEGLV